MTLLDDLKALIAKYDAPVEPVPVEPAPVEPVPVDTAPVDPVPVPTDPAPADPSPPLTGPVLTSKAEIDAALAAAKPGAAIYFSGDYPAGLTFKGLKFAYTVQLIGVNARAEFVDLVGCENLDVLQVTAYPTVFPLVDKYRPLFRARLGSVYCRFIGCVGMGHATGRDYYTWTQAEWIERKVFGIHLESPFCEAIDCDLRGVGFGILAKADDTTIRDCRVIGFSTDAYRILGDRVLHSNNVSADSFNVDPGHDDGTQGWEDGADKVLTGCTIQNWRHVDWLYDRLKPFPGESQGLGMFDGMYDGWIVMGCQIATDHYHGIVFAGATNVSLQRNQCFTQTNLRPGYPQIRIDPAKATRGGFPSHHNEILECIAPRLVLNDDPATRIEDRNVIGQPRDETAYQELLAYVRAVA